jgi:Secretion system C-terminal sorting domain
MKKDLLVIFLCSFSLLNAQQIIGSFPTMDGGFEGQTVGALTAGSVPGTAPVAAFTCEGNNGTGIQNTVARTGTQSVNVYYSGTSTKRILQSPTAGNGAITNNTQYTVQYYYRTPGATGTLACMQIGVSTIGSTTPKYFPASAAYATLSATNGGWTKYAAQVTSTTSGAPAYGIGIIRVNAGSSQLMGIAIDVDDFVVYPGTTDITPPDPPTNHVTTILSTTSVKLDWTAPGTGVDGGGYMVVRTSSPTFTTPNVNGIYAVGNYLTAGEQVVYIGTATTFTDNSVTIPSCYAVYTVDKAFNYSTALQFCDDPPCPVELSSLVSAMQGRDVVLNWETKTEKNSDKFEVERSTNLTWTNIGSVKASVLSNSPRQYSFTDKNLQTGKYQYRLKMIDNNGSFQYSKIVETQVALPKNFELSQNYPNPFNPSTQINYSLPSDSKVTLEVYNINGDRIVLLVDQNQSAGFYTVNFNNKNISSGVYFYHLVAVDKATGNNFSSVKKMMLLK